jgi:hypothetical protein
LALNFNILTVAPSKYLFKSHFIFVRHKRELKSFKTRYNFFAFYYIFAPAILYAETRVVTWSLAHLSICPAKEFYAIAKVAKNMGYAIEGITSMRGSMRVIERYFFASSCLMQPS